MAKFRSASITADDLAAFVKGQSDFAFEMQVLGELSGLGFECAHGGTYADPVTNKVRQFDIRAIWHKDHQRLALAVECKNIQESSPILISAVPRLRSEAFHDLIHTPQDAIRTGVRTESDAASFYRPGEPVGKRLDQVGKTNDGILTSDDQLAFERIGQAVNSCHDLVRQYGNVTSRYVTSIVPVVVVPPARLWQVEYDEVGTLKGRPQPVRRATLFLNHAWHVSFPGAGPLNYRLSHVELVTKDAIATWVTSALKAGGLFPAG